MNTPHHNNFSSLLIALFCLFILIFFTKDLALGLYENYQEKQELQVQVDQSRQEWEDFSALEKQLEAGESDSELKKYARDFSQADFLEFLYSYIENSPSVGTSTLIKSVTFSEPEQNEIGFMQVNVDVSVRMPSLAVMWDMLEYLVGDEAKYKIFITNFSFPNDDKGWNFVVNLPLKIFYK